MAKSSAAEFSATNVH